MTAHDVLPSDNDDDEEEIELAPRSRHLRYNFADGESCDLSLLLSAEDPFLVDQRCDLSFSISSWLSFEFKEMECKRNKADEVNGKSIFSPDQKKIKNWLFLKVFLFEM